MVNGGDQDQNQKQVYNQNDGWWNGGWMEQRNEQIHIIGWGEDISITGPNDWMKMGYAWQDLG